MTELFGDLVERSRQCVAVGLTKSESLKLQRQIADCSCEFPSVKFAILASTNFDFLKPALVVSSFADRIALDVHVAAYNQIDQEVLLDNSALAKFGTDMCLLYARAEDIVPAILDDLTSKPEAYVADLIDAVVARYTSWFEKLNQAGTEVVCFGFVRPAFSHSPTRDFAHNQGQCAVWSRLNNALVLTAARYSNVTMIDLEAVVRRVGWSNWFDPKLWSLAKIAGGASCVAEIIDEFMPLIRERAGRRRKCLVLDLDNTMWGGIIGEDGVENVKLGGDYPGDIYRTVQNMVCRLRDQGVLLALNSKNNEPDAKEMFDTHPDMLLAWDDVTIHKVNWDPKSENLKDIAASLNVGMDSLVFLDDNPVEIEQVKSALPEVTAIQVPADLSKYPDVFARLARLFDGKTISDEDTKRARMYKENQQREELHQTASTMEDFWSSLAMKATIEAINATNKQRTLQLLTKTNQFNVTTKRHDDSFISSIQESDDWLSYIVRLSDRFGDNGIVMVVLVDCGKEDGIAEIDTFLMSCRVIGRTLEQKIISTIAADLRERGISKLHASYVRTRKNDLVSNLFGDLGFSEMSSSGEGKTYQLDVMHDDIVDSKFIETERSGA